MHWFENENIAYLFFSVDEFPERIENSQFLISYNWQNVNGGTESVPLQKIDFSQGVHTHQLQKCGKNKLCGSYSWKVNGPIETLSLKFQYDPDSDLSLDELSPNVQNHTNDGSANAYSVIPFGVFNKENNRLQFRVFHNFGSPSSNSVQSYGMKRKFLIIDAYLDDTQSIDILNQDISTNGYVFPANFCSVRNTNERIESSTTSKEEFWLQSTFDEKISDKGACLSVDFLDKNKNKILSTMGYGLRNPVVNENGLVLKTPLKSAIQVPVVIMACSGSFSDSLINLDFFNYQRHILQTSQETADVCFDINDRNKFRTDLRAFLQNTLNLTKQQSSTEQDYIFKVIFHENLSPEFYQFHSIVAEELYRIIDAEAAFNSPKLVGSLVYGSTAEFEPTLVQKKYLMWCPQNLPTEITAGELAIASPNCTTSRGSELSILGINFVAPMGPFPDLNNYLDYLDKYGDTGLAKDPQIVLNTVPSGINTIVEKSKQVTYYDNVRITIAEDEAIKVCYEKEGADFLQNLRFRPDSLPGITNGLSIYEVDALWNGDSPQGNYKVGINWNFPFWGGVSYKSQVAVDVVSVIPVFNKFESFEELGDDIWRTPQWNVGDFLFQCRKYCNHPFFDVNGVYRNNGIWKQNSNNSCTPGKHPVWQQESSE